MKPVLCGLCLFLLGIQQGWCFGFVGTRCRVRATTNVSSRRKFLGSSVKAAAAAPATRALVLSSEDGSSSNWTAAVTVLEDKRTSPRLWLESQPLDGAYTVLRCDYHPRAEKIWKVWGSDFHWKRLRESMEAFVLQQLQQPQQQQPNTRTKINSSAYKTAIEETERILNQLLTVCAELSVGGRENGTHGQQEPSSGVFMTTILWTLASPTLSNKNDSMFRVQGHICHAWNVCKTADEFPFAFYDPEPLTVVVACDPNNNDDPQSTSSGLPNRQPHPRAKLSAWCRERRPLEELFRDNMYEWQHDAMDDNDNDDNYNYNNNNNNNTTTKTKILSAVTVDEVLLVNDFETELMDSTEVGQHCLLEGLTSNLFVVYPNKVIRTANDSVLQGYARHLLLEAVAGMENKHVDDDWVVDTTTPIRLEEADQWQQIFLTSAIRLVVPIARVLVPEGGRNGRILRPVWHAPSKQDGSTTTPQHNAAGFQIWRLLYDLIVQRQYNCFKDGNRKTLMKATINKW